MIHAYYKWPSIFHTVGNIQYLHQNMHHNYQRVVHHGDYMCHRYNFNLQKKIVNKQFWVLTNMNMPIRAIRLLRLYLFSRTDDLSWRLQRDRAITFNQCVFVLDVIIAYVCFSFLNSLAFVFCTIILHLSVLLIWISHTYPNMGIHFQISSGLQNVC